MCVRQFVEGRASVYALVAKDQLLSFQDLSFAACSARERAEVEASARSQREASEARASAAGLPRAEQRRRVLGSAAAAAVEEDGARNAVAAASNLADSQMDEQWKTVSHYCVPRRTSGCRGFSSVVFLGRVAARRWFQPGFQGC